MKKFGFTKRLTVASNRSDRLGLAYNVNSGAKIIIDKKVRFRYPVDYRLRLSAHIDVRLPCPVVARRAKSEAEAKTPFALFDLSVLI